MSAGLSTGMLFWKGDAVMGGDTRSDHPTPIPTYLLRPVADRLGVVDLLAQSCDHPGGGPPHALPDHHAQDPQPGRTQPTGPLAPPPKPGRTQASGLATPHLCFLLVHHLLQDGHQPVFEFAVVVVGHQQVPNPGEGDSLSPGGDPGVREGTLAPRTC